MGGRARGLCPGANVKRMNVSVPRRDDAPEVSGVKRPVH